MNDCIKSVVITGPTGAIGIALIQYCIANNVKVLAICHKNSRRLENLPKSPLVRVILADLDELDSIQDEAPGYDVFYHLGWDGTFGNTRNNLENQVKNIQYSLDAVELAHRLGCKRFIGAGSQAEYGRSEEKLNAHTPARPENGYGIAKLCSGQMTKLACESIGMEHIWTRILSIYGPFDGERTMLMSGATAMLAQEETAFTKGEQIWDYLYSEDAARALFLIGEKGKADKIYCIGSGTACPVREYIQILAEATQYQKPIGFGNMQYAKNQVMHLWADITELTEDTGFEPEIDFPTGIQKMIRWLNEKNKYHDSML